MGVVMTFSLLMAPFSLLCSGLCRQEVMQKGRWSLLLVVTC